MADPTDQAIQRTRRYWYVDGLTEIAIGCLGILVGLLLVGQELAPPGSPLARFGAIALIVLVVGGSLLVRRVVGAAKARLTYPRTGYVAYRRPSAQRRLLSGAVGVGLGVVSALVVALGGIHDRLAAIEGAVIGLFLFALGSRLGLPRFYVLAGLSVVLGLGISRLGLSPELGIGVYFVAMGLALVASGGLTLWEYLRQTQPTAGDRDG